MKKLRETWGAKSPASALSRDELAAALPAIEAYDQHCLERPVTLDATLQIPGSKNYLATRVGVVLFRGIPVCTGTWVGPTWILTARHCLFRAEEDDNEPDGVKYVPLDPTLFSFQLDTIGSSRSQVTDQINGPLYEANKLRFLPKEDFNDQVILALAKPASNVAFPGLRVALAQRYDRLILYAFQRNASHTKVIRQKLDNPNVTDEVLSQIVKSWPQWIRFDGQQTCRIASLVGVF